MKIVYFDKKTFVELYPDVTEDYFFVMNNKVYRNNQESCESQEATVDFFDFIEECPDLGWRIG